MDLIQEAQKIQGNEFVQKVMKIAQNLQFHYAWLLAIMYYESRFLHKAQNASGATGLIQFMPQTAQVLGTSTQQLAQMTALQQLEFVQKFYTPIAGKCKSFADVYLYTFASAYTNPSQAPDNAILATGQSAYYHCRTQNVCTVKDFKHYATQKYNADFPNAENGNTSPQPQNAYNYMIENKGQLTFMLIVLGIVVYFLFFQKP